jgi:uncharacterized protein (TIGR03437 family)
VRWGWIIILAAFKLAGQTPSNASLKGKYWFREVLVATDTGQAQTLFGSLTSNGTGGFTYSGQQLTGTNAPSAASGASAAYTIQSSGMMTSSDPLRNGGQLNARLGAGVLVGSDTEAGNNVVGMFVAVQAPSSSVTSSVLNGTYWIASLEFVNGDVNFTRETLFQMTANGSGGFTGPVNVSGEATNLGNTRMTQTVSGANYTINADGSGTFTLPFPGSNPSGLLLGGTRSIYVASDGSFFFGGGTGAGGQGLLIGVRAGTNLTASKLNGLYWGGDLRIEGQNYSSFAGAAQSLGDGRMTWSRRLRTNNGALDVTALTPYTVNPDGSGVMIDNNIAVSSNGQLFLGSGLANFDTNRYELFFGVKAPPVSGTGIFLNPQGVSNVFTFAPAGNPIAPGEFIQIYGTGLPVQNAVPVPYPPKLNGVQLLINNTPAPLQQIIPDRVFAVVPYSITGPTATIVLNNNGAVSNTITVAVAATAPGVATVPQNGLGAGAIMHSDNKTLVSALVPASRGETVVIYLTGLGAVSPPVSDGAAALVNPLSHANSVLAVYFGGACNDFPNCDALNVTYQGLSPTFAGLYQVNVTIPLDAAPGAAVPLAIQTPGGYTDMADIAIQ